MSCYIIDEGRIAYLVTRDRVACYVVVRDRGQYIHIAGGRRMHHLISALLFWPLHSAP